MSNPLPHPCDRFPPGGVPGWVLWSTLLIGLAVVAGVCLGIPAALGFSEPTRPLLLAVGCMAVGAVAHVAYLRWSQPPAQDAENPRGTKT